MGISKEDAVKIKSFVDSLPEDKRNEFKEKYNSADEAGKNRAAGRILSTLAEKQAATENDNTGAAVGIGATGATLAAGAYGVSKGVGKFMEPFSEKRQLIKKGIEPVRQKYQISKNIKPDKIPAELKFIESKMDLSARDGVIKDTANNLAKNYPNWRNKAFENYGNELNNIDSAIKSNGLQVPIEGAAFTDTVLQKTADNLRLRGLEREAALLEKNIAKIDPNNPIGFSQAKQLVTDLTKNNPKIGRSLVENFGEFLSTDPVVAKTPAGEMFKSLQSKYSTFKDIDTVAARYLKGGALNTEKITKQLHNYTQGKGNPQLGEFLKQMGSEHPLTSGVKGIAEQVSQLENVAKNIKEIRNTKVQVEGLNREISGLNSKIKTRGNIAKVGAGLIGTSILGRMGGLFNIASTPLQAAVAAKDFEEWRKKSSQNPRAISRLNPMTGMPEIVNPDDLII